MKKLLAAIVVAGGLMACGYSFGGTEPIFIKGAEPCFIGETGPVYVNVLEPALICVAEPVFVNEAGPVFPCKHIAAFDSREGIVILDRVCGFGAKGGIWLAQDDFRFIAGTPEPERILLNEKWPGEVI